MLGKRMHAQTVFDWHMAGNDFRSPESPEGFRNLSPNAVSGCGRGAYLHEDSSIVYKVDPNRRKSTLGNEQEYLVARTLHRKFPSGVVKQHVRLPKVGMFSFREGNDPWVIVSMEYIAGVEGNASNEAREELRSLGLSDMYGHNYITDDKGTVWPIDFGNHLTGLDSPYS